MISLPINGGFYESDSLPISNQECTNYYVNIPQTEGALSQAALFGTPGIEQIAISGISSNANRGSHVKDGKPYFLNGDTLYRLDQSIDVSGIATYSLETLGVIFGTERASFADNGKQLMIVADGEGYIVDESDVAEFQQITDVDLKANGKPEQVVFIDSFFVVTTDEKKIIKSAANDGLNWNALDFSAAEADPDPIIAPIAYKSQLFIAGSEVIEVFENRGLGGFPFQRITGFILNKGVAAPFGIVKTSDTFMFIGGGVNESPAIWALSGSDVQKVSTTAIDNVLSSMSSDDIQSAFAWSYAQSGAYFVGFTLGNRTFVFDTITGKWHERKSQYKDSNNDTALTRWRVNSVVGAYNEIIVSDAVDGRIGILKLDLYKEYENNIPRTFSTAPFSNQGAGFTIPRIEITMESGEGVVYSEPNFDPAGLYSDATIGVQPHPFDKLGSDVTSSTTAIIASGGSDNTSRGSLFSSAVIDFGNKKYYEIKLISIGSPADNFYALGFTVDGDEQPGIDLGQNPDNFAFLRQGDTYIDGNYNGGGGFVFGVGDNIGFAVDYSLNQVAVDVYKNGLLQASELITITSNKSLRPSATIGAHNGATGAIGASASMFTSVDSYEHQPPTGFDALESAALTGVLSISEPKIRLSISKDSKTFNNELSRGFGKVGEFFKRSIWRRLGRFSRYSVLKFEMSDAVKPTIIKLEADIKGGTK